MRIKNHIFILCCFVASLSYNQFSNLKFENLDTYNGLSSSTCVEIFQDRDGFLWFGTIDGLNKYNGYEFEVYRSVLNDSTSISNNRINTIEQDRQYLRFYGVTINIDTKELSAFGKVQVHELQIIGNNNVLKTLTMVDYGSVHDAPGRRTTNIVMDGRNSRIEGFHVAT